MVARTITAPKSQPDTRDAELGVIGSILQLAHVSNQDGTREAGLLAEDFGDPSCRAAYRAILSVVASAGCAGVALVRSEMQRLGMHGHSAVLAEAAASVKNVSQLGPLAEIVQRGAAQRYIVQAAQAVADAAMEDSCDPADLASELRAKLDAVGRSRRAEDAPRYWTMDEIRALPEQNSEWIIQHMFARGELTLLVAPRKEGKSFALFGMFGAVSRGSSHFCGLRMSGTPARVLVFTEENANTMREKHDGKFDIDDAQVAYVWLKERAKFSSQAEVIAFARDAIERFNPSLVVFDTLSEWGFTPPDGENNARVMDSVMRAFRLLAAEMEVAVCVTHHTRKDWSGDPLTDSRGSGAITAVPETIIGVKIPKGQTRHHTCREVYFAGRHTDMPSRLDIEYAPATRDFRKARSQREALETDDDRCVLDTLRDLEENPPPDRPGPFWPRDTVQVRVKELRGTGINTGRLDNALRRLLDRGSVSYELRKGYRVPPEQAA